MITQRKPTLRDNFWFFSLIYLLILFIFILRIVNLQIINGVKYLAQTKIEISEIIIEKANRGIIYDRNGVKLVENIPKFKIYLPKNTNKNDELELTITNLSNLLQKNIKHIYEERKNLYNQYDFFEFVPVADRLDYHPYILTIESQKNLYPLAKIEFYMQRLYLYSDITSHILGYITPVTPEDLKIKKYNYSDEVGRTGVEQGFDDILRGIDGIKKRIYKRYPNDYQDIIIKNKIDGQDLYLSIDINAQKKLYDLIIKNSKKDILKNSISYGAVVQEVKTGEIIALASYPNFDSNKFINGITQEEYNNYLNDPGKPLMNKVISYPQPPGSTFKVLTQIVSMYNGDANKNTKYYTGGVFNYGGVNFVDFNTRNFGEIDMVQALCVSSNIYHMKLILDLDEKTNGEAANKMYELFDKIGLNTSSGINIGQEEIGYFPTPNDKKNKGKIWVKGDLLNASIGQGDVKLTVMGSAKLVNFIASKGKIIPQTILKDQNKGINFTKLDIPQQLFETVNEGMECATKYNNSLLNLKGTYPEISIKTGSAETGEIYNGRAKVQGWEISYAPSKKPKYSMSIFIENGTHGWKAGYISREMYKYLLNTNNL